MTSTTAPCVNGCVQHGEHDPLCDNARCPGCLPTQTDYGWYLCERCHGRLADALEEIPTAYALLARVLEPGSAPLSDTRPAGKRSEAPTPLRLAVADYRDGRLGWRTDGTTDRRGTLGLLESWARLVREERYPGVPAPRSPATITSEAGCLSRHLDWIAGRPWVDELYAEITEHRRHMTAALGASNPRPLGTCPAELPDGRPCGTTLWPSRDLLVSGITCPICGAEWTPGRLLLLGKVIGKAS